MLNSWVTGKTMMWLEQNHVFVGDKDGGLWARGCGKAKDLRVQGGTKDAGKKTDN